MIIFDAYSKYYDLLYKDKDYLSEAAYIDRLLQANNVTKGELLEFGSGTGKHGALLANMGYSLTGIDFSQRMIDEAVKLRNPKLTFLHGDIAEINLKKQFDAVISLFHVMSYQISNNQFSQVLRNANRHLNNGGLFIFDFWYLPAVLKNRPSVRVREINGDELNVFRVAQPHLDEEKNIVKINYSLFIEDKLASPHSYLKLEEIHAMRYFSLPEIDFFAQISGFELINSEEFVTGKNPENVDWAICTVLKKIREIN
jgi:SAM-dependent methyltransferase